MSAINQNPVLLDFDFDGAKLVKFLIQKTKNISLF